MRRSGAWLTNRSASVAVRQSDFIGRGALDVDGAAWRGEAPVDKRFLQIQIAFVEAGRKRYLAGGHDVRHLVGLPPGAAAGARSREWVGRAHHRVPVCPWPRAA